MKAAGTIRNKRLGTPRTTYIQVDNHSWLNLTAAITVFRNAGMRVKVICYVARNQASKPAGGVG
jgi:hypothetical protein